MNNQSSFESPQTDTEATTAENPSTLLAVLAEEYVQEILSATSRHPLSAEELASTCGLSLSTVYRKTNDLVELGLLTEQFKVSSEGRHTREFRSSFDRVEVTYTPEDQFTNNIHWRGCNEYSPNQQSGANTQ